MAKDTQNEERLAELEKTRRWLVQEWKRVATYGRGPNKARTLQELSARARALLMEYSATVGVLVIAGVMAGCAGGKVGSGMTGMTGLTRVTGLTNRNASLSHSLTFPLSPSPTFSLSGPTVTLGWDRGAGTNVMFYEVYHRAPAGNYITWYQVGLTNEAAIPFREGTNYYQVRTYDTRNFPSPFSNEIAIDSRVTANTNTNFVSVVAWVEGSTNLVDWRSEYDLPLRFYLSNQPPVKFFRARATAGWNQ